MQRNKFSASQPQNDLQPPHFPFNQMPAPMMQPPVMQPPVMQPSMMQPYVSQYNRSSQQPFFSAFSTNFQQNNGTHQRCQTFRFYRKLHEFETHFTLVRF